jgi:methylglutaconyl-CoA hydratase
VSDSPVLLSDRDGAVVWLTLNRPEKRNALNRPLVAALKGELAAAGEDTEVRVVGVRGAGKDFCAGADLDELRRAVEGPMLDNLADVDSLAELFLSIRRCRKPVVALVHGRALAGGCGLATACDLVIASEGSTFGYPEVQRGFVPAMVMAILRRSVSEKVAFELVTLGRLIQAREALSCGMINRVLSDDAFAEGASGFVQELAARSASAVQLCKRLLYLQDGMTFETAIRAGADLNVIARMTDDTRRGIDAFLSGQRE